MPTLKRRGSQRVGGRVALADAALPCPCCHCEGIPRVDSSSSQGSHPTRHAVLTLGALSTLTTCEETVSHHLCRRALWVALCQLCCPGAVDADDQAGSPPCLSCTGFIALAWGGAEAQWVLALVKRCREGEDRVTRDPAGRSPEPQLSWTTHPAQS